MKNFLVIISLITQLTLPISVFADETPPAASPTTPPPQDSDRDGKPDNEDNCPSVYNPGQFDGNANSKGIACDPAEQTTFYSNLQTATDNVPTNSVNYNDAISGFGNCFGRTDGRLCTSQNGNQIQYSGPPSDSDKMWQLYQGLTNNKITAVIEEPIGNENIYNRARICETKYLKDRNGLLQFQSTPGSQSPEIDFGGISNENDLATLRTSYESRLSDTNTNVIITLGKCEEFFVANCTPVDSGETNDRFVKIGDPLPVKVFCDRVQVLFAESGSDLIKTYVGLVYRWASGIVGIIAVLVIIVNGIRISTAGGDQSTYEGARDSIIKSLVSIALLFLAGILLYSINPNFFTSSNLQESEVIQSPSGTSPTSPTDLGPGDYEIPVDGASDSFA